MNDFFLTVLGESFLSPLKDICTPQHIFSHLLRNILCFKFQLCVVISIHSIISKYPPFRDLVNLLQSFRMDLGMVFPDVASKIFLSCMMVAIYERACRTSSIVFSTKITLLMSSNVSRTHKLVTFFAFYLLITLSHRVPQLKNAI